MITEGLIKLPKALYAEMERFTLEVYYAHVQARIDRGFRFDEEGGDRAQRILNQALAARGVTLDGELVHKARKQLSFMKQFRLQDRLYGVDLDMKVKLKVLLERHRGLGVHMGQYLDRTAFIHVSPFNLHMTGPSLGTVSAVKHSLNKVDELLGYLEHEVTHLVQYRILRQKSEQQVHDNDYDSDNIDDRYTTAQLEFDPLIKSAKKELLTMQRNRYFDKSKTTVRDAFLSVIPTPEWMRQSDVSGFFDSLKRNDVRRWRKAVKLFTATP